MKKTHIHLLVIAMVGLIAYSNSFGVPFQFDDLKVIVENPFIKDIDNFTSLKSHSHNPGDEYNSRRYLGYLSLALNYRWGELEVYGYHMVNMLIHLINGILVYFFVVLTFRTPYLSNQRTANSEQQSAYSQFTIHDSRSVDYSPLTIHPSHLIALSSALLFVSHPIQTQAVTYIVQRFTSLATLFYIASVVFYIKGRLTSLEAVKLVSPEAGEPKTWLTRKMTSYGLSLVFAVFAMKTKEIAFTLPIMILMFEFIFFRSTLKRRLLFLIPVLLTLVIVPISVLHIDKPLGEVLSDLSEKSRLQTDMPRADYLMTEMRVIVTYIRLLFVPVNQNLDYDYPIERSFFNPPVFLSFLLLAALFGTAMYLLYRSRQANRHSSGLADKLPAAYSRLIAFGILWFFLALSVESSIIPIVDVIFEHRVYLPSIGAFAAFSTALIALVMKVKNRWAQAEKVLIGLLLVIVTALSVATFARNSVWNEEIRLWEDVVMKSPGNARTHNNLGFFYNSKGMNDQAIEEFLSALRLKPDYPDARINLGIAYNAKGMFDQAIEQFLIALSMNPDDADAHNNIGIGYVSKGLIDEGIRHYQMALSLQPGYAEAFNNLGVAYGSKGMLDQAKENFEYAVRMRSNYFEANYNLMLLYGKMGDYEKAEAQFRKIKELKPAVVFP